MNAIATTALMGRMIGLMRRRLPVLVSLAFWPYLALVVLCAIIGIVVRFVRPSEAPPIDPIETWRSMAVLAKLGVVLSFIAFQSLPWGLATAGISLLVHQDFRGQELSIGSVLTRLRRRLPSLLALSFIVGGATIFGSVMLILPGLAVIIGTAFAVHVMINEGAGIVASLRRSVSLIGDRFGTIFTLTVALAAIGVILQIVLVATLTALATGGLAVMAMMWSFIGLVPPTLILVYAAPVCLLYCDVLSQRGELQPTCSVELHP